MIALLRGRVAAATLGEVVLDVGGVGYHVFVPPGADVGTVGRETTLHTYLVVREDALTLYGFPDAAGRGLFATLLAVSGVGPKLALAALGTLGADGLRRAVVTEDVAALTVVPGVGRKSAQRMVLELRERLGAMETAGVPGGAPVPGVATTPRDEVRQALAALGYAPAEVAATLEVLPDDPGATPEQLLRDALRSLGRR
ncbi:MAG: Holliday junction branch migration protein RuvA [Euzebyales bacterium]|nr:Holliday junction branch migration protein RuvA [Euzebyales bacterium]